MIQEAVWGEDIREVWKVSFSPDGDSILAGCGNVRDGGTVFGLWDANTLKPIRTFRVNERYRTTAAAPLVLMRWLSRPIAGSWRSAGLLFRIKLFADVVFEFVLENDQVKALKQRDPSGEYVFPRR